MKNKVLIFIIGVLVGAILTTIVFYFYAKNLNLTNDEMPQMMQGQNRENIPEKPMEGQGGMQGTPPEMPTNQGSNI